MTSSPSFTPTVTQTSTVGPTATFNPFTTPTQTPTPGIVYRRAVVAVVDSDALNDGGGALPIIGNFWPFVGNEGYATFQKIHKHSTYSKKMGGIYQYNLFKILIKQT